jgi:hypothetical protein
VAVATACIEIWQAGTSRDVRQPGVRLRRRVDEEATSPGGAFLAFMTVRGCYGDGRTLDLPDGWAPASNEVLETCTDQTLAALTDADSVDAVARYYDRDGSYAGTLFLDVEPNDPFGIEPSDLYAVTTLSMKLDARHGRLLLDDGDIRTRVGGQLRNLDPDLRISDLDRGEGGSAEMLTRMYDLHRGFRSLLAGSSNRWVTAAKLCARKRPRLFPVRDNLVCEYLGGGRPLKSGDGWPGDFSIDIQVYAYLLTNRRIDAALNRVRSALTENLGVRIDQENLKLLDSVLWMAAGRQRRT